MIRLIATVMKNDYTETVVDHYYEEDSIPVSEIIKWMNDFRDGWCYVIEISNYG